MNDAPSTPNLFPPTFYRNPYPFYAQLRAAGPLVPAPGGRWMLTSHRHVNAALADRRLRVKELWNDELAIQFATSPFARVEGLMMLNLNPPDHRRLRGLVSRVFTPRYIAGLEPQVQQLADRLIDAADGGMDLIPAFAYPLPIAVIAAMLGVPEADHDRFHAWSRAFVVTEEKVRMATSPTELDPALLQEADTLARSFGDYFRALAEERRVAPREDLISALVAAEEQGDALSMDELVATCILLITAGHETTMNLIGNGLLALLRHPEQLELLRKEPELARNAVEELLRYDSPVQLTIREVPEPVTIEGVELPGGSEVFLLLGAANHDPARYAAPAQLDIRRERVEPTSFGNGIHVCLGAHLARLEGRIALNTLLRRLPGLRLAPELRVEELEWNETLALRGLRRLPLVW